MIPRYDLPGLRAEMERKQLSTFQVGAAAGIPQPRLYAILNGKATPDGGEIFRICCVLGIEEADFTFEVKEAA